MRRKLLLRLGGESRPRNAKIPVPPFPSSPLTPIPSLALQCSSDERSRFHALGTCLPEGPVNRSLTNCVDVASLAASGLVYLNPKARMSLAGTPAVDSVLCVSLDNSPILGRFLEDPGTLSPAVLSDPTVARKYSYRQAGVGAAAAAAASPSSAAAFFDVGARIPAALVTGPGALRAAYGGSWALPLPGADGACTVAGAGSYARFREPVQTQTCTLARPLSADTCEALSAARLVTSLVLGRAPNVSPTSPGAARWAPVALGLVTRVDPTTGATSPGFAGDLNSSWVPAACACAGAVVGVSYRVTYDPATNTIVSAVADVATSVLSQPLATCGASPLAAPVTVSVAFLPSTPQGSSARYERSGQPGYFLGAPVLAGVLVAESGANPLAGAPAASDRVAIQRSAPPGLQSAFADKDAGTGFELAGLTLRGPAVDGSCVPYSATAGLDRATPLAVRFGEDVSATCALRLDAAALAALCATPAALPAYLGLGYVNTTRGGAPVRASHVGVLGNSDPWKAWQWTRVDAASPQASASWDPVRQTCTGLVSGVDVEFLTASVGSAGNPQRKIVASRLAYVTDTWAYAREDVRAAGSPQTFQLRTTVTFTEYKTADPTVFAPAPPVIPKIPSDLWYPFQTADDTAASPFMTSGAGDQGGRRAGAAGLGFAALAAAVGAATAALVLLRGEEGA